MPIQVRYQNNSEHECIIRPTPLVNISTNILKNGAGDAFGVTYAITLTGTLLPEEGTPYALHHLNTNELYEFFDGGSHGSKGPDGTFDTASYANGLKPPRQKVHSNNAASAIFSKQKSLRALFAQDGQRVEITDIVTNNPAVIFYPRVVSVNFSEGTYVNRCEYSITLEADTLMAGDGSTATVEAEGSLVAQDGQVRTGKTEDQLIDELKGAFIADFNEDWSIETDDAVGEIVDGNVVPRSYRISHTINATGKTHHKSDGTKLNAWEQAKAFVQNKMSYNVDGYPNVLGTIGDGTLDLVEAYGGYNHVRTEQLNESAGTYNVSENWLIARGTDYENYSMSISSSATDPFTSVSVDGNIKGLTLLRADDKDFGGKLVEGTSNTAYQNALAKYNTISNNGAFGLDSTVYTRANTFAGSSIAGLNPVPVSESLATNEYTGEITYNLSFNNRPTNLITGAVTETISVNDTYPGDMFSVIPVLGRATGPVLQYVGGRTEYKRDVSISLTMDTSYISIPFGYTGYSRGNLLLQKPSINEPTATEIASILKLLSPQGEPGVRKFFVSPPTENWNPKEGTYSLNISFIYELDR